jgi:outer membrane lipoprotein SlyB
MGKTPSWLLCFIFFIYGCSDRVENSAYDVSDSGKTQLTYKGIIEKATIIQLQDDFLSRSSGSSKGGLLGGFLGFQSTQGSGGSLMSGVDTGKVRKHAIMYTIRLKKGGFLSVTQGIESSFEVGQQVQVVIGQGKEKTRILSD